MTLRTLLTVWIILILATALTAALPHWGGRMLVAAALGLMILKNALIADVFMGLRRAPAFWRVLIQLYTPAVALMVLWLLG